MAWPYPTRAIAFLNTPQVGCFLSQRHVFGSSSCRWRRVQAIGLSASQSSSLCKHNSWTGVSLKQWRFCSPAAGSSQQAGNNGSNPAPAHPQQPPAHTSANSYAAPSSQQPQQGAVRPGSQSAQQPNASPTPSPVAGAGSASPPRTSAAAEVIDKYLGPSTLKLDKRDDRSPPRPPPPPRRNYGPQGTQEKKSGKDLVAESAACAVIEKYLGPWPGFPPRDPKIDEYLDSLPENAACAAIDKYFGPYKPLFVFKKNEENANNPPPPSRPPRSRMVNRARNRAWNASQQGATVDRPWTAPQQQGPTPNAGGGSPASQPGGVPSHTGYTSTQTAGTPPPQGASTTSQVQGTDMQPPHSNANSQ
ncbi:hypothetical protein L7F22_005495 [Adiantum nelumboides]|nr:hypothetical protein [Adiantum nelumboides]